jgi:hypothetical protein
MNALAVAQHQLHVRHGFLKRCERWCSISTVGTWT